MLKMGIEKKKKMVEMSAPETKELYHVKQVPHLSLYGACGNAYNVSYRVATNVFNGAFSPTRAALHNQL